jgi:hypothetical protein
VKYPVADVDRFQELTSHSASIVVRGVAMTIGRIARGWLEYEPVKPSLKRTLALRRSDLEHRTGMNGEHEHDLWIWLGAQLLEFQKDEHIKEIVKVGAPLEEPRSVPRMPAMIDGVRPTVHEARSFDFDQIYERPMLSVADFALSHHARGFATPGRVPREVVLWPATEILPVRAAGAALGIVVKMRSDRLAISDAGWAEIRALPRRNAVSERDVARLGKILGRLPASWELSVMDPRGAIRALQAAIRDAGDTLKRALDLSERIGRALQDELGEHYWPLAIEPREPRATRGELRDFSEWLDERVQATRGLALLGRAVRSLIEH